MTAQETTSIEMVIDMEVVTVWSYEIPTLPDRLLSGGAPKGLEMLLDQEREVQRDTP
jgi:hypothetical protein